MWSDCLCPEPDLRYKLVEPGPLAGAGRQGGYNSVDGFVKELAGMGFATTSLIDDPYNGDSVVAMKNTTSNLKYEAKAVAATSSTVDSYGMMLQSDGYIVSAATVLPSSGLVLLVGTRVIGDTFMYEGKVVGVGFTGLDGALNSLGAEGYVATACAIPGTTYFLFASRVAGGARKFTGKSTINAVGDTKQDIGTMAGQGFVPTSYCIRENDSSPGPYVVMYMRDPAVMSVPSTYLDGNAPQIGAMAGKLAGDGYFVNLAFGFYMPYQLMGTKRQ
jgi:hypothetical protein